MNKKLKSGLISAGMLSMVVAPVATVVACGDSDADLKIMYIPSRDPVKVQEATSKLEPKLGAILKKDDVGLNSIQMTTASNYEAAAQALKSGSTDVAFLPYGTYTANKASLRYILQAARDTIGWDKPKAGDASPLLDYDEKHQDMAKALTLIDHSKYVEGDNKTHANFEYTGDKKATWYRSQVMAKTGSKIANLLKSFATTPATPAQLKEVEANIKLIYTSLTSSSSYSGQIAAIQRIPGLKNFDIKNVSQDHKIKSSGYDDSIAKLRSMKDGWVVMGIFTGVEAQKTYIKAYGSKENFMKETVVVALSLPIINDGAQVARDTKLSDKQIEAIQNAYVALIAEPANKDIFDIYAHTAYAIIKKNDAINKIA